MQEKNFSENSKQEELNKFTKKDDSKPDYNSNDILQETKKNENESKMNNNITPSDMRTKINIINCKNILFEHIFVKMFSKQNILYALIDKNHTIYLQKQLRIISKETIDYIIGQLQGIFREIMKDKNGNYFCSDLFKECDQEQRIKILKELSPTLADDCLNNYSSHAIQTLIDRASSEYEYRSILYSFNDYNKLLYVSLDPCGAYTIQKIIEKIPDRYREEFNFIFSSFIGYTSRKKYGIVTVKKFISGTRSELVTEQIMRLLEENFMNLAVDQYSNYLIQFLLEEWKNTPEGNEIKKMVRDNFEEMSEKKYSSFICKLYITKIISPEEKKEIIIKMKNNINTLNINNYSINILQLLGIDINSNNISHLTPNYYNINNSAYINPNNNMNIDGQNNHEYFYINNFNFTLRPKQKYLYNKFSNLFTKV